MKHLCCSAISAQEKGLAVRQHTRLRVKPSRPGGTGARWDARPGHKPSRPATVISQPCEAVPWHPGMCGDRKQPWGQSPRTTGDGTAVMATGGRHV